jgi:hypothetical protein
LSSAAALRAYNVPLFSVAKEEPQMSEVLFLPVQILHKRQGIGTIAFVTEPFDTTPLINNQDNENIRSLLAMFATAWNIYSWVPCTVGNVTFNDVLAIRVLGGLRSPQLQARAFVPVRLTDFPDLITPPGELFQKIVQVSSDDSGTERPALSLQPPGLWFSPLLAEADTIVGYQGKLYIIPYGATHDFLASLLSDGDEVFRRYESCDDPTTSITDELLFISADALAKKDWGVRN